MAHPKQRPPLEWSPSKNVVWKTDLPGGGHGSPIVVGDQVVLAAAETDAELQSVICLDRKSGRRLWKAVVHRGGAVLERGVGSAHAAEDAEHLVGEVGPVRGARSRSCSAMESRSGSSAVCRVLASSRLLSASQAHPNKLQRLAIVAPNP